MVRRTCYITKDRKNITHDVRKAMRGRAVQGMREVRYAELDGVFKSMRCGAVKRAFAQSLYDAIADDVLSGKDGGSYLLDGSTPTSGYCVGGARLQDRPAEELVITGDEALDRDNVMAAVQLMAEEVQRVQDDFPDHLVVIGFWRYMGDVFFDASALYYDEDEAAEQAFRTENEWAYYDIGNGVEVFLEDYLNVNGVSLSEFADFKSSSMWYRHASGDDISKRLAWYMFRNFGVV